MTEPPPLPPTIHVVEDDDAVRDSLQLLLEAEGYRTLGFSSGLELLNRLEDLPPGCVIADVRMPDMSGLELQERLVERGAALPVVVISGHGDIPMAVRAMKAGAVDFIEKPFTEDAILDAVRRAATAIPPAGGATGAQASALAQTLAQTLAQERLRQLTGREREVLMLLVQGQANKMIAHELDISPRTVEIHRARVMTKMGADSLAHLVRLALAAEAAAPAGGDA